MLKHIKDIANKDKNKKADVRPHWVSSKNITLDAYNSVMNLYAEKLLYINSHKLKKDFFVLKHWQINASEVARSIDAATSTLISTSAYSPDFKRFLDSINKKLLLAKDKRLEHVGKLRAKGSQQKSKVQITDEFQILQQELIIMKKKNAETQVKHVLDALSPKIKKCLLP